MGFFTYMQHYFLWWPSHYIGLPVSDSWVMGVAWFSVFWGWLAKIVIFKFAGTQDYAAMRPFFVRMIVGQLMGAAMWMGVNFALGEVGNVVFVGVW